MARSGIRLSSNAVPLLNSGTLVIPALFQNQALAKKPLFVLKRMTKGISPKKNIGFVMAQKNPMFNNHQILCIENVLYLISTKGQPVFEF